MRTHLLTTFSPVLADVIGKTGPNHTVTLMGNFETAEAFLAQVLAETAPEGRSLTLEARVVLRAKIETSKQLSDLPANVVHIEVGTPSTETQSGRAMILSKALSGYTPAPEAATPKQVDLSLPQITTEEGVVYTPWTDGRALGFKATASDGRVDYVILNPSGASEGSEGEVFVYASPTPSFADDGVPVTFVSLFQGDDA